MERGKARTACVILAMLLFSIAPPTASADPGDPEVVNNICETWNSTAGICDDYNFADDETTSMEWIEGRYNINMVNSTVMSVTLEWAIHEIRRDDIMLEDLPLGNGSNASMDGIPADYIRNYLDYVTLSGSTVRDMLLNSVTSTVTSLINNGFGTATGVQTSYVNQITYEDQSIQCTDDRDEDSADEVAGLPNDAYNPPLCLRTTMALSVDPADLGMTEVGMEVERAYQGLLTMGGTVRTDMNLTALPGHAASYEFVPPSYGTVVDSGTQGDLIPASIGGYGYTYARWLVDHKEASDDEWLNQSASITMARRETTTKAVELDIGEDRGLQVEILVDASDERATTVEVQLGIHHIGTETLDNWDWSYVDNRVNVPWVTADGLRLAHHTQLADLSDFADKVPVEDMNDMIADVSPINIEFEPFAFSTSDQYGGLDFVHSPGTTCAEPAPSTWCILGETAMNGTYPVYLTTQSNAFDMDFGLTVDAFAEKFEIDLLGFDPNIITQEDRAAILNGVVLSGEFNSSSLVNWMEDQLPRADVTLEIILPDYVRSTQGNPETIRFTHTIGQPEDQSVTITGAQPYDWRHSICRGSSCGLNNLDLICGPNQRTCVGLNVDIELSDLNINEWSQSVDITAGGQMEFLLHRVGVPQSILDENPNIDIEAIPSDLIRRFVHFGDQMDGGLLAPLNDSLTVPVDDEDVPFVLSEQGLNDFASRVAVIVEEQVNDGLQEAIEDINQQGEIYLENPGYISISASVDGLELLPTSALSDLRPIRVLIEVSDVRLNIEYVGNSGSNPDLPQQAIQIFTNSLLAANEGGSGIEIPPGEDIEMDVPTPFADIEDEIFSPSVRLRLTLPWGIDFSNFKSEMGRGEITDNDGSQMLTYYVPLCISNMAENCEDQIDTLSFRLIIGVDYILAQLAVYIGLLLGLFVLLFMLVRRRRRRKKERKKAKEESEMVGQRLSDLRIINQESYGSDGLPDMNEFAGLDAKGNIPKETWEDEFNF
jgi:hypothetical protein